MQANESLQATCSIKNIFYGLFAYFLIPDIDSIATSLLLRLRPRINPKLMVLLRTLSKSVMNSLKLSCPKTCPHCLTLIERT